MKFLIGEGGMSYLERLTYWGVIGLFYMAINSRKAIKTDKKQEKKR